ncbi:MAG: type II secretion system protein M [Candidatus Endonucleobacter bathymodioli]|uniref:Type II secretion system protein M n=1 Tax=Candidatus Endonucleibacter bathymodioli TaxID=539814 RepID=A0AA90NL30_9GAMM|nr:type II secretion system protein M [Candidatus Endonucleobacter bathymodioli]
MQNIISTIGQIALVQQLLVRYAQLPVRQKNTIAWLIAVIVAVLFYVLLFSPIYEWSEKQRRDYGDQVNTTLWMQQHITKFRDIENSKRRGVDQQNLPSVVTALAKEAGVTINRMQPNRKGISIWLEDAAYQKVLSWLVILETKHQVVVQKIKLERFQEEGRVKGYIHLSS